LTTTIAKTPTRGAGSFAIAVNSAQPTVSAF
jgi:hypothetical protein